MASNAVSGRYGDVRIANAQVCDVGKWSFNPKVQINSYASNCTNQSKKKVAGTKDGSGSLEGFYNPTEPIMLTLDVGTSVTLKLYLTATVFYSVPAIIESLKVDVDIDSGDFVKWTADFQADGAWTNPVAAEFAPRPEGEEEDVPADVPQHDVPPHTADIRATDTPARREARLARLIDERLAVNLNTIKHEWMQEAATLAANAAVAAIERYFAHREAATEQTAAQAA